MTEQPTREASRPSNGVLRLIGLGLSFGLLAIVIGLGALLIVVPRVAGATPLTILTESMEPSLPPGTLIVIRPVEPADIRSGDVITYQIRSGDPAVISHRVIAVTAASDGDRTFTTKGDNNDLADPEVIPEQVRGKLWYSVPYVGYVNSFIGGETRSWLVPALAVGLFGYAAFMIISGLRSSARKRRAVDPAATPPGGAG
ncbi:MAG: signal peptidase I [Leifsonia sp.]